MSRFIKNGPDKEMKNAREVRETILTLHEDELDNALWINDLHIVPMTREAEPEIPHEIGAGQLEMFLDLVCSLSTTSTAFFLDITRALATAGWSMRLLFICRLACDADHSTQSLVGRRGGARGLPPRD
jgi:hypothetical protein